MGYLQIKNVSNITLEFPTFRCKGYIPVADGCVMMLSAKGGTGKTYALINQAVRYCVENPTKRVALWMTEDPTGFLKHRLSCVIRDYDIDEAYFDDKLDIIENPPEAFIKNNKGNLEYNDNVYRILDELAPYDFIILDPLLAFFGGNENDNSQARFFMQIFVNMALAENKTIFFIHHNTKGSKDELSKTRGAGAFVDACRIAYELKNIEGFTGEKSRQIVLTKDNWGAAYHMKHGKGIIKVIPDDTSVKKPDYVNIRDTFLMSYSQDKTYNFEVDNFTLDQIKPILQSEFRYCAHGFKDGHRHGDNVDTHCDLIILDIDDGYSLDQAKKAFAGYNAIIATTKSHQKNKNGIVCDRFRVIIPLKESMTLDKDKYRAMMHEIFCRFPFVDKACKDNARAYMGYPKSQVYYTGGKEFIDGYEFIRKSESRAKRKRQELETKYKYAPKTETEEQLKQAIEKVFDECFVTGSRNSTIARLALWIKDSDKINNSDGAEYLRMLNSKSPESVSDYEINQVLRGKLT